MSNCSSQTIQGFSSPTITALTGYLSRQVNFKDQQIPTIQVRYSFAIFCMIMFTVFIHFNFSSRQNVPQEQNLQLEDNDD
jgi:hypothetical protein